MNKKDIHHIIFEKKTYTFRLYGNFCQPEGGIKE